MRHTRLVPLLLAAALLLGCTRQTSAPTPSVTRGAATTVEATPSPAFPNPLFASTPTPSATPAPTMYVEVATGTTSTTAPSAEFPKPALLGAQPEVDRSQLPSGAFRGLTDPTGRYLAYIAPSGPQWQGVVRDTSNGKEWKVDAAAVCQCDGSLLDPGPVWSSSGRFVAFGTGDWREGGERDRRVVVVEPAADRVTELPKAAWLSSRGLGGASVWRPGYDVLAVAQLDGVFMYDAAARTSTMMSVGTWPRFVTRDLVQYIVGTGFRSATAVFYDIWLGREIARLPFLPSRPVPLIEYNAEGLTVAAQVWSDSCTGVVVAHPALTAPSICIPGAHAPAWSPDRRTLAYSRIDGGTSRSVVLFDPATGAQRAVAERLPASQDWEQYLPTWSADGRFLRLDRGAIPSGA